MIDLKAVGAHASLNAANHAVVQFGVYLPQIRDVDGFSVLVRVIHERDQFDPGIPPRDYALGYQAPQSASNASPYDLWTTVVDITADLTPATHFGQPGTYVYRYQLLRDGKVVCIWFTDPFARA